MKHYFALLLAVCLSSGAVYAQDYSVYARDDSALIKVAQRPSRSIGQRISDKLDEMQRNRESRKMIREQRKRDAERKAQEKTAI